MAGTMTDRIETLVVHAGAEPDPQTGAVVPPIQMSATFKQDGVGNLRAGFEYGRSGNPTRLALEETIAALENAIHGLAYASGLAASQNLLYLLESGDRLLMSDDVYGGTWRLADKVWRRYGIQTDAIDLSDLDAVAALFITADMGKGRIAAEHLAVTHIHDAAADRSAKLKPDFVKSLKQCRIPGKPTPLSSAVHNAGKRP